MSYKQITYPPKVVTGNNEIILDITVIDAYVTKGLSQKGILLLIGFHEVDDSITFSWNNKNISFTCVPDYTGQPGTYPVRTSETIQQWGESIFRILVSNYELSNSFIISGQALLASYRVYFEPFDKFPDNNLTIDVDTIAQVQVTNSSYTPDELYENYRLKLQLLYESLEGSLVKLSKFRSAVYPSFLYLPGTRNASLQYDLSRLVYNDITGHFTFPESNLARQWMIIRKYYIQLSFLANNLEFSSLPADQFFYVLPGKLSKNQVKQFNTGNTNLYNWIISGKKFLSFAPNIKYTDIYSPEKLYFLFIDAFASVILFIEETLNNDSVQKRALVSFSASGFSVYEFSVGFQKIKQQDYGNLYPVSYDIWLEDNNGSLISERRTFHLDYTHQRNARYFLFKNSFGVYELFRSTGIAVKSGKIEKEFYSRNILKPADNDQLRKVAGIQSDFSMRINSGYLSDPWNYYFVSEFLSSEDVFWLKNDRAYAIQVESSNVDISRSDMENNHEFDFIVSMDDLSDDFFQEFGPGSELPAGGDFSNDFSEDFNI